MVSHIVGEAFLMYIYICLHTAGLDGWCNHTYIHIHKYKHTYIQRYIHKITNQIHSFIRTSKHPYTIRHFWNASDGVARSHPFLVPACWTNLRGWPGENVRHHQTAATKTRDWMVIVVVSMGFNNSAVETKWRCMYIYIHIRMCLILTYTVHIIYNVFVVQSDYSW